MKYRDSKLLRFILHALVWLILFSLPMFFFPLSKVTFSFIFTMDWVYLIFAGVVFYLNYLWLIERLAFNKKLPWFILVNILLIAGFTWLNHYIIELGHQSFMANPEMGKLLKPDPDKQSIDMFFKPDMKWVIIRSAGTFIIPVIISLTLKVLTRLKKSEAEKKEIQTEHLLSELEHLKHQLQPHFFFNALNNIYSLVDISPEKSKEAIHGLAKLVRYLLYETDVTTVNMSQEIDFLNQYIRLMKLRLTEKTSVQCSLPEDNPQMQIAPLLFLPLVENAFKHGVSTKNASVISITLKVLGNEVLFLSRNAVFEQSETDKKESGIGLENLRRRLELLYPGRYSFDISYDNRVYTTRLLIKPE